MTSRDTRLDRLSDRLTAQERALLVLRSWKEGREEDWSWRWSMPAEQVPAFNRLIELMNGVNVRLLPLIVAIGLEVDKLHLRLGGLALLTLWNHQTLAVDAYLRFGTKRRNGHVLLLESSLEHAPLRPVVHLSEELQELLAGNQGERAPTKLDELGDYLKDALRAGVAEQTRYLRAAEIVVAEVAEEFAGEDPALPHVRELIDDVAGRLADVAQGAENYTGPLAGAEPDEELVDKVRALVEDRRP